MAYNPYEDILRRQRQQTDVQPVPYQPTAPLIPQAQPQMEPLNWMPMGGDGQQSAGAAAGGMASLLKRFMKPAGASPNDARVAWEQGGSL